MDSSILVELSHIYLSLFRYYLLFVPGSFSSEAIQLSDLPPPDSGVLGLNRLIQPIEQDNSISIYYPNSYWNGRRNSIYYTGGGSIVFQCIQPTKRIAVHANPLWHISHEPKVYRGKPTTETRLNVSQVFFNADEGTLIIDMVDDMQPNTNHTVSILTLTQHLVDEAGTYGIRAFNRTSVDTGEEIITIGMSPELNAMRRFIPCFDDPVYTFPHLWSVGIYYGDYAPAIVNMNGERTGGWCSCPCKNATTVCGYGICRYGFSVPKTAVEITQLRVAPLAWYADERVPPVESCIPDVFQTVEN